MLPEEYTDDPILLIDLKNQLISAKSLIDMQKNLIEYQDGQIQKKDIHIDTLIKTLADGITSSAQIKVIVPINNNIIESQNIYFLEDFDQLEFGRCQGKCRFFMQRFV